jgi:hypothetical protein
MPTVTADRGGNVRIDRKARPTGGISLPRSRNASTQELFDRA